MGNLLAINGQIINSQEPLPIPVDILTLLWENPNPGAAFSAQDITLASDEYDFLLLICRYSTTYDRELSFIVEKGKNEFINAGSNDSGGAIGIWRDFNRVNDTKYSVSNAYYAMGANAQTNNDTNLIPQRIYGFKKQVPMQSGGGGTKYDPETDMLYLWDGTQWVEWKKAGLGRAWDAIVNDYPQTTETNRLTYTTDGNTGIVNYTSGAVDSYRLYFDTKAPKNGTLHVKGNVTKADVNGHALICIGPNKSHTGETAVYNAKTTGVINIEVAITKDYYVSVGSTYDNPSGSTSGMTMELEEFYID